MNFLVMTGKNIFADQLFLSLNISDFNLFFMWKLQPLPKKSHPPLSQQPPLKVEFLPSPSPPFWKFSWRFNPSSPFPCKKGGGQTMYFQVWVMHLSKIILIFTSNGQGVVRWIYFKQQHRKFIKFNHFMPTFSSA